jgi:hypothetical protein
MDTSYKYSFSGDDSSYRTIINNPSTSLDFQRGDLLEQTVFKFDTLMSDFCLCKKKNG